MNASQNDFPFLHLLRVSGNYSAKTDFPNCKILRWKCTRCLQAHMCVRIHFLNDQRSKIWYRMTDKALGGSLRLLPLTLALINEWYIREVSTTSIPLIEILQEIFICYFLINLLTHALTFLVFNLVNMLFYASFYWKWPTSCHVFWNGPSIKRSWTTLSYSFHLMLLLVNVKFLNEFFR